MTRILLTAMAAVLACALALGATASASADTPTPSPEPTLTPSPTPNTADVISILVIEDLNKNGVRDTGEPGSAGWTLYGGCSDALIFIEPPGNDGKTSLRISPYQGRVQECIRLQHRFGWLETTTPFLQLDFPYGEARTALFLVHNLDTNVMEVNGELIIAGVPARDATVALAAPFAGCLERPADYPYPLLMITGNVSRPGCPQSGDTIVTILDGTPATALTYVPASTLATDLVARGDSMRLYASAFTAARIDGIDCAVIEPLTGGLIPPESVRVFVLSEEVRPGCGAPGRLVRFYREGQALDPLVPWRAGQFNYSYEDFVPAAHDDQIILPPNTGAGPQHDHFTPYASLALAAVLIGASLKTLGLRTMRPASD